MSNGPGSVSVQKQQRWHFESKLIHFYLKRAFENLSPDKNFQVRNRN